MDKTLEVKLLELSVELVKSGYVYKEDGKEYPTEFTPHHIGVVYYELRKLLNLD